MNKLYMWANHHSEVPRNEGLSNIDPPGSSCAHSAGVFVIAEDANEACELLREFLTDDGRYYAKYYDDKDIGEPVVVDITQKGVVFYADGDC